MRFLSSDGLTPARTALIGPSGLYVDAGGTVYASDGDRVRKLVPGGVVTTVAGTGRAGFAGDGGAATDAELWLESGSLWGVMGLAGDAAGNLYIADEQNNRIRMVTSAGRISTFAGAGQNNPGDGGPAREATLDGPRGLVMDSLGNLFVAESDANRVRKISPNGRITTVAGTGDAGFAGDGGPAARAQLYAPEALAVDASGNLYIADTDNNRIRMVDPEGTITTVAGSGQGGDGGDGRRAVSAKLHLPRGLAIDPRGNLYIADTANNKVRMVDVGGTISTLAGTGTPGIRGDGQSARSSWLKGPVALALGPSGNLYIADSSNDRIREVALPVQSLRIVAPNDIGTSGPFDPSAFDNPFDINLASNVFGGLYRYDARLHVVPDIAAGPPEVSRDGLTYTFKLKPYARFSNGAPVTAADFIYSWSRAVYQQAPLAPFNSVVGYEAVSTGRAQSLLGLDAPDDHTLVARLTEPDAFWVDQLVLPGAWVVNRNIIQRYGQNAWWTTPEGQIGTGPFRMTGRVPSRTMTFAPVPNWWGGSTGTLGEVQVDVVPSVADQISGYQAGRFDILGYGLSDQALDEEPDPAWLKLWSDAGHKSEVHINPYARTEWIAFSFASGPFAGRVEGRDGRLAFSLAIDRRQLAAAACDGGIVCTPAGGGVISKGLDGYLGDGADPNAAFNPAMARAALRRWDPDGSRERGLEYTFDSTPLNRKIADNLHAQWKANLGVDVQLQELDRETFFINRAKGAYTLFRGSWLADYNHPQDWFDVLFRSGAKQDWGAYENRALDGLVTSADQKLLSDGLPEYRQAGRILLSDVVYGALVYWNRWSVVKPYVSGYGFNALYDYPWSAIKLQKR